MQVVSEEYKNYINEHNSLTPKSKIIVDGIEYLGDTIKTAPKFSHSNSTYIGGFSAKTVDFEMINLNNDIDFENKEVTIYKGLVINGVIEYVKQGIFIPQASNIETNINSKTISFKNVTDKTQLLDDKYESSLDWSEKHSGLEIVQEICNKKNIILETLNFSFADYMFKQPNFSSNITNREVISRLAEIGGEVAIFNNNGNLSIKGQFNTNDVISRKRYNKLTKEKAFCPNVIVLGAKDYDNDIMYPHPKPENAVEFKIEDNPFVDLYREEMIEEVAKYIIGKNYIPFEMEDFVDGFIYELNDVIEVTDKEGNNFDAVILNLSTSSRIKSKISASVRDKKKSNYNLAGSNKQKMSDVKLEIDHVNQKINGMATDIDDSSEKVSQMLLDVDSIKNTVSKSTSTLEDNVESLKEQMTQLQQLANSLSITITNINTNGVNKVVTSTGFVFDEKGLNISKDGEPMSAIFDNQGFVVKNYDTEMLVARGNQVITENLKVRKYLGAGRHRFEKFTDEKNRLCTGMFWVGDN